MEALKDLVNADQALVRRGRYVNLVFMVGDGSDEYLIKVSDGRIESVVRGPFTMPDSAFSLRAEQVAWAHFREAVPPPGYHDLLAMLMHEKLQLAGNLHPFMANLFYFKGVMESLREGGRQ